MCSLWNKLWKILAMETKADIDWGIILQRMVASKQMVLKEVDRLKIVGAIDDSFPMAAGKLKCPTCGGELVWTWNRRNKHTSGKCRNGCVEWIE
jgi:hypothetical protein